MNSTVRDVCVKSAFSRLCAKIALTVRRRCRIGGRKFKCNPGFVFPPKIVPPGFDRPWQFPARLPVAAGNGEWRGSTALDPSASNETYQTGLTRVNHLSLTPLVDGSARTPLAGWLGVALGGGVASRIRSCACRRRLIDLRKAGVTGIIRDAEPPSQRTKRLGTK